MTNTCVICGGIYEGLRQTIEVKDDKGKKILITGHVSCTDKIYNELKQIKNIDKLSVEQLLKMVKLDKLN